MQYYQSAISRGIFILPLIALIPLVPYYWKKRQRGVANPFRLLTFYSFMLYALICWYFVVLPLPSEVKKRPDSLIFSKKSSFFYVLRWKKTAL